MFANRFGGKKPLDVMRADEKMKGIPVVAVPADTRFQDAGFDGKLFKPITLDSVSKLLTSFVDA